MNITKPRGTNDIFYKDINYYNYIVDTLMVVSKLFNYNQIITPIFELKDLFIRNIGETSDIVTKEFYDFFDKGNRELVLRPEGTVPVIRSIVENKLLNSKTPPLKFFYIGPMFRYERPQNGRSRQFNQFGIENVGIKSPYDQIEVIQMAITILESLNIKNYSLKINYIGNIDTRKKWIDELKKYFLNHKDKLTEDSKNRIDKNPLRILDDKIDAKKDFVINAPKIDQFLTKDEIDEIKFIKDTLYLLKVKYEFDSTMVRGLDYYFGLVFEFVSNSKELSNSTIIGGGKYTKLVKELGGPDCDCVGFALGIERLIKAFELENKELKNSGIDIYVASLGNTKLSVLVISKLIRALGYSCEINYNIEKLDKHFKYAEKFNPKIILVFGEKEKANESIIIKNQLTKKEIVVKLDLLQETLKSTLG